jgi:hypothetical protein
MHASRILRRCLGDVLGPMHAARSGRLLGAVEALVAGRRLTLTDLARSWPGATWMHAPLKALDRLLGNHLLHDAVVPLQRAMARWLMRGDVRPLVLVDWADLKGDGRWALLRAAVPVGGRALTLYEQVFPLRRMGQPQAQREFLQQLGRVVPAGTLPILVTDAGFRSDWLRAVRAMGWDFIGRLRNNTQVASGDGGQWRGCAQLHSLATGGARDMGAYRVVKGNPLRCRLVLAKRQPKGRERLTRAGLPEQGCSSRKARKAAREPWLLVTSLAASTHAAPVLVAAYGKRMQIEEAFRDLKSHRYGAGFEDSLSRKPERLAVLLLLHALASFAAWLLGLAVQTTASPDPLSRQARQRGRYSLIRRGIEWLRRVELPPGISDRLGPRCLEDLVLNREAAQL